MKNILRSKFFKIGTILVLAVALICGVALPVLAQGNKNSVPSTTNMAPPKFIKGTVTTIDTGKTFFDVQTQDTNPVRIKVDNTTKYYQATINIKEAQTVLKDQVQKELPPKAAKAQEKLNKQPANKNNGRDSGNKNGPAEDKGAAFQNNAAFEQELLTNLDTPRGLWGKVESFFHKNPKLGQKAVFEDIQLGDIVVVQVTPNENLAKQVMIIKTSNIKTIKGTITAVTETSFTITPAQGQGEAVTLTWDANTRVNIKGNVSLKIGQVVSATYTVNGDAKIAKTVNAAPAPATTAAAN
jgi:hypothetical protein